MFKVYNCVCVAESAISDEVFDENGSIKDNRDSKKVEELISIEVTEDDKLPF